MKLLLAIILFTCLVVAVVSSNLDNEAEVDVEVKTKDKVLTILNEIIDNRLNAPLLDNIPSKE